MKFYNPLFLIISLMPIYSLINTWSKPTQTNTIKTSTTSTQTVSEIWLGKWERQQWQNHASLEITSIQRDSIEFDLTALSGVHTGGLAGMAIVKGNTAIYLYEGEYDTCMIQFKLIGDSVITIDQKQGYCDAGDGVTYSGEYKNEKILSEDYREIGNLKTLGIFKTEKEDSLFKLLVGDGYDLFINSTQLTVEDKDLDNLNVRVRSSGIRGLFTYMENIIMIDSLNNIWAAVIDDNKIYYYTNKKEYKKRLPKTIENWRKRFLGYPVIYK